MNWKIDNTFCVLLLLVHASCCSGNGGSQVPGSDGKTMDSGLTNPRDVALRECALVDPQDVIDNAVTLTAECAPASYRGSGRVFEAQFDPTGTGWARIELYDAPREECAGRGGYPSEHPVLYYYGKQKFMPEVEQELSVHVETNHFAARGWWSIITVRDQDGNLLLGRVHNFEELVFEAPLQEMLGIDVISVERGCQNYGEECVKQGFLSAVTVQLDGGPVVLSNFNRVTGVANGEPVVLADNGSHEMVGPPTGRCSDVIIGSIVSFSVFPADGSE